MLEIAKGYYIQKSKVLGMKIINKDGKFWVLFKLDSEHKAEKNAYSAEFATEEDAKVFLDNCAANLLG